MYDRYRSARESPEGLWKAFFFSWQAVPKYRLAVSEEEEALDAQMNSLWDEGTEEAEAKARKIARKLNYDAIWYQRAKEHRIFIGEVRWAMEKLRDLNGDVRAFDQQFPLTWEMAFLSSGNPVFDQHVLTKWSGMETPDGAVAGSALLDNGKLDGIGDAFWQFRAPESDHEYVMATDSASGSPGGDYSSLSVMSRQTREFVFQVYTRIPPDELGRLAARVQRMYNMARYLPEINNHGYDTVRVALDCGAKVERRHPHREPKMGQVWSDVYGFYTSNNNRTARFDLLAAAIREESITVWHRPTLAEMRGCTFRPDGRPDHKKGGNSDSVDTHGLCLVLDERLPPAKPLPDEDAQSTVISEPSLLQQRRGMRQKRVMKRYRRA